MRGSGRDQRAPGGGGRGGRPLPVRLRALRPLAALAAGGAAHRQQPERPCPSRGRLRGEVRAPAAQRLLADVTGRLVAASERPSEAYQVTILNSPVVNAFALPNGRLYVTRGLLALANDTAEVAAVLTDRARDLAPCLVAQRTPGRSDLLTQVTRTVLNNPDEAALLRDRSRFTIASFSRSQELEADQAGVQVLARAGYDPFGVAASSRRSGARAAARTATVRGLADMLAIRARARRISQAIGGRRASAPGIGESDRARYLQALDGLAYGDDPADGLVRGRRFAHARLGVAFEAPEGFSLENTSQAVLGSSADGSRRLLFDAAQTPEGQSLEEVLRSTWSDSIEPGSMEATTINGLPAAIALSRGGVVLPPLRRPDRRDDLPSHRRRQVRHRRRGAAVPPRARHACGRSLPRRRRPAAPAPADRRGAPGRDRGNHGGGMAVDRPYERFLLLNGLDRGGALKGRANATRSSWNEAAAGLGETSHEGARGLRIALDQGALQFLERAILDLAHPLLRDAEAVAQEFQGDLLLLEAPRAQIRNSRSFSTSRACCSQRTRRSVSITSPTLSSGRGLPSTRNSTRSAELPASASMTGALRSVGRGEPGIHERHVGLRHADRLGDLAVDLVGDPLLAAAGELRPQPAQVEEERLLGGARASGRSTSCAGCSPGSRPGSTRCIGGEAHVAPGSNRAAASSSPTWPSCTRSAMGRP